MDANRLFDLIAMEAIVFDLAVHEAEQAATSTAKLEATSAQLDACFGILEHVAVLRLQHPEWAETLAATWRETLLAVHRVELNIVDEAAASHLAR